MLHSIPADQLVCFKFGNIELQYPYRTDRDIRVSRPAKFCDALVDSSSRKIFVLQLREELAQPLLDSWRSYGERRVSTICDVVTKDQCLEFITGTLQHSLEQLCSQDSDSFQLVRDMLAAANSDAASGQVLSKKYGKNLRYCCLWHGLGFKGDHHRNHSSAHCPLLKRRTANNECYYSADELAAKMLCHPQGCVGWARYCASKVKVANQQPKQPDSPAEAAAVEPAPKRRAVASASAAAGNNEASAALPTQVQQQSVQQLAWQPAAAAAVVASAAPTTNMQPEPQVPLAPAGLVAHGMPVPVPQQQQMMGMQQQFTPMSMSPSGSSWSLEMQVQSQQQQLLHQQMFMFMQQSQQQQAAVAAAERKREEVEKYWRRQWHQVAAERDEARAELAQCREKLIHYQNAQSQPGAAQSSPGYSNPSYSN
jgi:hypothetical protein